MEPEDSLRMGDEHLDTISETESDEFIKSSVENLVPNLSESEDLSDNECDVPACDDFTTFSNLLFDADDNFSSRACLKCNSGARNSFTYDPNLESFNEVQNIFNPPPQSHYNKYLCQICESNSRYGYECSQRVSLVYEPKPCYNQSFADNAYPHDSPGVTPQIDHYCCYTYEDSLDSFFCHQCTCEFCGNGAHDAIAITLDLPTVEPKDSLRIRDEHLDTISKTESDEFIKSSVEDLVPKPSEFEDEHECDVSACDDFTTFSNLLFDADDDLSSSDNESFSDEDVSKEIYSNPLFDEEIISMKIDPHHFNVESDLIEYLLNHASLIISSSSKIDSLLDEFAGELILLKSIPSGIDKTDYDPKEEIRLIKKLFYDNSSPRPPKEFISENSDAAIESFSLFPIPVKDSDPFMEEIDLFLAYDESIPSVHFDSPSSPRPPVKPPDDDEIKPNSGILTVKMVGDISKHDVHMPRLLATQPTHVSNQEKSPHLLSHRGLKTF
nr:hypothetical protein [Tanacetum cinerariifolium]